NYSHQIIGTTEINGKTYYDISLMYCRFREEDGKVYSQQDGISDELVIIDFTLEVGDTYTFDLEGIWNPCYATSDPYLEEMTVVSKTIEFIAGMNRIVIEFDEGELWIEGIGSTRAFVPGGQGVDSGALLSCFTKNGNTYFFNDFTECIYLDIESYIENQIIIYPNPVTKTSILQFPEESEIDTIKIFDVSCRLVTEEIILKDYYTIDAMQYSSGLYFYQVLSEGNVLKTDRFIIK
ncbi:MAG TPA: hypothetical protein DCS66_13695, partial [Flavobacteriaceae bacterium]|nr:hypothetical protein [Flavobacteriaceae bacterium]